MSTHRKIDRPAFLILGAMKCGTTSLAESLVRQTNVVFPCGKEPRILNREEKEYTDHIEGYISKMIAADSDSLVGDASPQLTFRDDLAAQRALELFGQDVRMVYIVRDPVARAVSHFRHAWQAGWKMAPTADEAFEVEPMLKQVSSYQQQLSKWTELFDASQILVIQFEDMIRDQEHWLKRVCEHIHADLRSEDLSLEHSNRADEQGKPIVPQPIWNTLQAVKRIQVLHSFARSNFGVKLKGMLMKSSSPPKPSVQALETFAQSIQKDTTAFENDQGWDDAMRWDLMKTAQRLGIDEQ